MDPDHLLCLHYCSISITSTVMLLRTCLARRFPSLCIFFPMLSHPHTSVISTIRQPASSMPRSMQKQQFKQSKPPPSASIKHQHSTSLTSQPTKSQISTQSTPSSTRRIDTRKSSTREATHEALSVPNLPLDLKWAVVHRRLD